MSAEQRYQPDDGCPLFSERLEQHIVAITRGETPNRGRFCGHCYTPMSPQTARCPHCDESAGGDRPPVEQVPDALIEMLRVQRATERAWVNSFAFLGVAIAVLGGLAVVLSIPALRDHLLPATIVYAALLLVGSRMLAGFLGGYYGDRIGYDRARRTLRESWASWLAEREGGNSALTSDT